MISAPLDWQSAPSVTTKAVNTQSTVHVSGNWNGEIYLQMAPDGTENWLTIYTFEEQQAIPLVTPDLTVNYRFSHSMLSGGSANVYFGA